MPALHIFIDTNILLNFYHFADDRLEILDELTALVSPGKVTLHLPKQVENELKRNRESKLQFAMTDFKNAKLAAGVPHHMRGTEAAKQYDEAIKSAEQAKKVLIANAVSLALSNELDVDQKLSQLFNKATRHPEDDAIYSQALIRMNKGNPPGKPQSIGDRYIWETLLAHVPDGDLFIISKDGDYSSPLTPDKTIRPLGFLSDEWNAAKNGGKLTVFKTIREVVEYYKNLQAQPENVERPEVVAHEATTGQAEDLQTTADISAPVAVTEPTPAPAPAPQLVSRELVVGAINDLVESGSFFSTHGAVANLIQYLPSLTKEDAERLFQAAIYNNQIRWIISDEDVNDLYLSLVNRWVTEIDDDLADEIIDTLGLTPDPDEEEQPEEVM